MVLNCGIHGNIQKERRAIVYWLVVLVMLVSTVSADINGYLKGFAFIDPHQERYDRLGTRFQTRFAGGFGTRMEYFAAINYELDLADTFVDTIDSEVDAAFSRTSNYRVYPVEYYLDLHLNNADFRIGQQFIFWGSASWVNPTDVINPWDYANMSGEVEDYRLPVLAVNVQWYFERLTLQGVIIPGFTPSVMSYPPGTKVIYPDMKVNKPQLGLRGTSYSGNTDLSIYLYRGYDQLPSIQYSMDMSQLPPVPQFLAEYNPISLFGLDFIRPAGAWNIMGEAAYVRTADEGGNDVFITNSNIQSALGLDYIWSEDLSLNMQYNSQLLLDYEYSVEQALIQNMGLADYLSADEEYSHSISSMISWSPANYVTSQLIGQYNLEDRDSFIMGFVSWEMADATQFTIGTVLFSGAESTTYGKMDKADRIFIELKRSF